MQNLQRRVILVLILAAGIVAGISATSLWATVPTPADAQSANISQLVQGALGDLNANHTKPTISTSGTATTKVTPDKFSVTLAIQTSATTAEAAAAENANASAQVVSALKALGIPEGQISTSSYTISPVYAQPPASGGSCFPPGCPASNNITGYVAANALTATLDTAGTIDAGKVIDTAVHAGANSINQVSFFLSEQKQQQVLDSLIQQAIANARHSADVAAKAVGMNIVGVQSITTGESQFPVFSVAPEPAASASTQILPGQQDVTMTVGVAYYMG